MGILHAIATTSSSTSLADYYDSTLVTKIGTLITTVLGWITSNPILALFFTMSMIGFAFVVIGWLKGAIRLKQLPSDGGLDIVRPPFLLERINYEKLLL